METFETAKATLKDFISRPQFNEDIILGKDASWPRVTIVTPSFNQARYLEQTILSVLNQNYPNLEYIVMDGGSTDGSIDIIRKYEKYIAHWTSHPDGGQAAALRAGFGRATGAILAWINSDDVYLPGVLRKIGQILLAEPNADVCYGNMYVIDEEGKLVAERRVTDCSPHVISLGFRYGGFGVYQPAAFWRQHLYESVGGINPSLTFCMDNDLFIRFVFHGGRFRFVRAPLSGFRVHSASKTSTLQQNATAEFATLVSQYELDWTSLKSQGIQLTIRMYRAWKYLVQGDGVYLAKRLLPSPWNWVP